MAKTLKRPVPSVQRKLEIQAGQTSTLNGQVARNQLAELKTSGATQANPDAPTTSEEGPITTTAPEPMVMPIAASEEATETENTAVAEMPVLPAQPQTGAIVQRRGPGRPRATVAAPPTDHGLSNADTTQIRVSKALVRDMRRAKMELDENGRRTSVQALVDEGLSFYLEHLRTTGQISKRK